MTAYNAHKALMSEMPFAEVASVDLPDLVPRPKPRNDQNDELVSDLFGQIASHFNTLDEKCKTISKLEKTVEAQNETITKLQNENHELSAKLIKSNSQFNKLSASSSKTKSQLTQKLSEAHDNIEKLSNELSEVTQKLNDTMSTFKKTKVELSDKLFKAESTVRETGPHSSPALDVYSISLTDFERDFVSQVEHWYHRLSYNTPIKTIESLIDDAIASGRAQTTDSWRNVRCKTDVAPDVWVDHCLPSYFFMDMLYNRVANEQDNHTITAVFMRFDGQIYVDIKELRQDNFLYALADCGTIGKEKVIHFYAITKGRFFERDGHIFRVKPRFNRYKHR